MDIRLLAIAAQAAGTYFLVTDNSLVPTTDVPANLRLFFVNTNSGPVNTAVVFQKGDSTGLQAIYGKVSRQQEKKGNFSISACLTGLEAGPIAVINLRAFSELDQLGVAGLSPNKSLAEADLASYESVFNTNGLWTITAKNIQGLLSRSNLLNFANVGASDVSYFVVKSKNFASLTNQAGESIRNTTLDIDDYPSLDADMLLSDTFVDVYVFNNTFDKLTVSANKYYGHLFDADGMVNYEDLDALSLIPEAGFNRMITGSIIPNLVSESATDISIDTVMNQLYPQTGLVCHINDDLLEADIPADGVNVLNTDAVNYYKPNGTLNGAVSNLRMLSHNFQPVTPAAVDLNTVTDDDVVNRNGDFMLAVSGTIFPAGAEKGNRAYSVYEQGIRIGDEIVFTDVDDSQIKTVKVTGVAIDSSGVATKPKTLAALAKSVLTIPVPANTISFVLNWTAAANATKYIVWRKKSTDANYAILADAGTALTYTDNSIQPGITYLYVIVARAAGYVDSYSAAKKVISIAIDGDAATIAAGVASVPDNVADLPTNIPGVKTYSVALMTLSGNLNALSYTRKKDYTTIAGLKTVPSLLVSYKPRIEQFTDGTASKQSEILDVMNTDGISRGIQSMSQIRYLVDAFKSFVEGGYKHQFGQLLITLDKSNKFVRAFINEPFLEDIAKSTNPLFRQAPGMKVDYSYLQTGGNPNFSSVFLSKFTSGAEMCFFYGAGKTDAKSNVYPIAPAVSNLFIQKTYAWDIIANASGHLDNISGVELSPNFEADRLPFEKFNWNPIVNQDGVFTVYGNLTGQKKNTSLQQIHNSELLCYIKGTLLAMTKDDPFKKGLYNEYLASEVEVQSFMDGLALANAIQPGPIVICNSTNNTTEVSKQKIKLIHIEYTAIDGLEKVVFDLNLK